MSKRYRNKPPKNIIDLLAGRPMLRRLTQDDIEYAISYEIEALLHAEITRQEISTSHLDFFKQKTAYEILSGLVGSEMCIRDSY